MAKLDKKSYRNTALYQWIHKDKQVIVPAAKNKCPLLEVLPANCEQEQAILHSLNEPLTIITGPPGTGKSQVVTELLINAAWLGMNVLFTSKNNKAVDVVETRANALGKRPIILRLGSNQYAGHLADLISELLSAIPDVNAQQDYEHYCSLYQKQVIVWQQLQEKKAKAVALRNRADHMEQRICVLRERWSKWFPSITNEETAGCENAFCQYYKSYETWHNTRTSFWGRLFWFLIGKKRTKKLSIGLKNLNTYFQKYELPTANLSDQGAVTEEYHRLICEEAKYLDGCLNAISNYKEAVRKLLQFDSFEKLDRELSSAKVCLNDIAEKLWSKWLLMRIIKLDTATRNEMNDYVSSMHLLKNVDLSRYPELKKDFYRLQRKMSSFLPCWAVTSLSARGKVPFAPGIFDLVIIDEASQCDIASALPMLYRAKKAVILGDPKQLSHISTLSNMQDLALLKKHNVNSRWSYSNSSLYMRAAALVQANQIISLRDHHRSCADIIEFSNQEFYDGKLRVATDYTRLNCPRNVPLGIRWLNITGRTIRPVSGSAYNDQEAKVIVKELWHLVGENKYHGSIGVVTPFRAQAEGIRHIIEKNPKLQLALLKNDFLVDTVHKFQGDERDVIFFSPVISQGCGRGALHFLQNTGNLFNVAITRAKAVLIVVGDLGYCSKCGISYMEHFVSYVNTLKKKTKKEAEHIIKKYSDSREYPTVANPEQVSDWERLFYTALFDQGIKTIPQYPVERYKLDLAIIQGEKKLDIEIDGEMYHKDWNGELSYRDQLRNQRLFELGWSVKRFWVYQIRDDLQECINQIKQWCGK